MRSIDIKIFSKIRVCIFLSAIILVVYLQVISFDFVFFDDPVYVTNNMQVQSGITIQTLQWAFCSIYEATWQPLTWISYMIGCQLFGLAPGYHHFMNVVLHITNTILLFLFFQRATKTMIPGLIIAFLFGIHPIHVESVAWVAERKDVLSAFFWMLTLYCYIWYLNKRTFIRYVCVFLALLFGLMAKQMLVTLPFVLLLLDYWPLGRIDLSNPKKAMKQIIWLFIEKIPLFAVILCFSFLVYSVHKSAYAVQGYPLDLRISNALVAYMIYLYKAFWPFNLIVFYPYPDSIPVWKVCTAGLLIITLSCFSITTIRKKPWLFVGWFWYLGTFIPVIGIVQINTQAMADRFAYLPFIGVYLILAKTSIEFYSCRRIKKKWCIFHSVVIFFALSMITWVQISFWQNTTTLFNRALAVNPENYLAHNILGVALAGQGKMEEAIRHFKKSIQINPTSDAYNDIAQAFLKLNRPAEAIQYLATALKMNPGYPLLHTSMGDALSVSGKAAEAEKHYRLALRIAPSSIEAYNNLGVLLFKQNKIDEAITVFQEGLKKNFQDRRIRYNYEIAEQKRKEIESLIVQNEEKLKHTPNDHLLHYTLATLYDKRGIPQKAEYHFEQALRFQPRSVPVLNSLANHYIQQGKLMLAISIYKKMIAVEPENSILSYEIAKLYIKQKKINESFVWLQRAVENGYSDAETLEKDMDLADIKDTIRFKTILNKNRKIPSTTSRSDHIE